MSESIKTVTRRAHFHADGVLTSRLTITMMSDMDETASAFVKRHVDAVTDAFSTAVAEAADNAFDAYRSRGRAYRFRPYMLDVAYEYSSPKSRRGKSVLTVTVTLSSSWSIIASNTSAHTFAHGAYIGVRR